jgi:hypothetical protein
MTRIPIVYRGTVLVAQGVTKRRNVVCVQLSARMARARSPGASSGDQATDVQTSLEWAQQYACSQEKHPECSPYYASASALASFPSTLMIVGDQELMLSETTIRCNVVDHDSV